jgi:carboxypeptidase C (cathepsin A)
MKWFPLAIGATLAFFASPVLASDAVTQHTLVVGRETIRYTARAGTIVLYDAKHRATNSMFYTAYIEEGADPAHRPVTFFYNGGPGGSSVWQRMAAFGPVRVIVPPPGQTVRAPYRLVGNQYSLLDHTDEVYVDAPGTGFSRLLPAGKPSETYGVDQDATAFATFVRSYLSRFGRWNSPKFLFGESYGTIRSAVVARMLANGFGQAVTLNGIVLMSSALNVDLLFDDETVGGNDWPFVLFLPTEAATAWYYHRLPDRPPNLPSFLDTVERFALTEYVEALAQGDDLDASTRAHVAAKLASYTGLTTGYLEAANLRVTPAQFRSELLRDRGEIVGYMDARYPGYDPVGNREPQWDTSDVATTPEVLALFNDYVRTTLNYRTDLEYRSLIDVLSQWSWKHATDLGGTASLLEPPDTIVDLSETMAQVPSMRVFAAMGYYDFSTPYFQQEYDFAHLHLTPQLRDNLTIERYEAGHMAYIDEASLAKLKADLDRWYDGAS